MTPLQIMAAVLTAAVVLMAISPGMTARDLLETWPGRALLLVASVAGFLVVKVWSLL